MIVISSKNKGYDEVKSIMERNFFTKIEKKTTLPNKKYSKLEILLIFLLGVPAPSPA